MEERSGGGGAGSLCSDGRSSSCKTAAVTVDDARRCMLRFHQQSKAVSWKDQHGAPTPPHTHPPCYLHSRYYCHVPSETTHFISHVWMRVSLLAMWHNCPDATKMSKKSFALICIPDPSTTCSIKGPVCNILWQLAVNNPPTPTENPQQHRFSTAGLSAT